MKRKHTHNWQEIQIGGMFNSTEIKQCKKCKKVKRFNPLSTIFG